MLKNVSVAMAAYNGEKYLSAQIKSIICQLSPEDELVISLDPSVDKSAQIIQAFSESDNRIKFIKGPGRGVIKNFENALEHCNNEIIFLCDQDDVWLPDKVSEIVKVFDDYDDIMVVMHDAFIVDDDLNVIENSFFKKRKCRVGLFNNIIQNSYIGCCMAFRRNLLDAILPFPDFLPMHDQWIGIIGEIVGKNYLLKKPFIYYRRHEDNVSSDHHAGIWQMLKWRWYIIKAVRIFHKKKGIAH